MRVPDGGSVASLASQRERRAMVPASFHFPRNHHSPRPWGSRMVHAYGGASWAAEIVFGLKHIMGVVMRAMGVVMRTSLPWMVVGTAILGASIVLRRAREPSPIGLWEQVDQDSGNAQSCYRITQLT